MSNSTNLPGTSGSATRRGRPTEEGGAVSGVGSTGQIKRKRITADQEIVRAGQLQLAADARRDLDKKLTKIIANPLVMDAIAKNLPARELKQLRETCISWNRTFIPELKKKHRPIVLNDLGTDGMDRDNSGDRRAHQIVELTNLMRSSKEIPFAKYEIRTCSASDPSFQDFFSVCGSSVTSLFINYSWHISGSDYALNIDSIRRVIFEQTPELADFHLHLGASTIPTWNRMNNSATALPELPKLKQLVMEMLPTWEPEPEPIYCHLINDLIHRATNLQSLECRGGGNGPNGGRAYNWAILTALRDLSPHLNNLLSLQFRDVLAADELGMLIEMAERSPNQLRLNKFSAPRTYEDDRHRQGEFDQLLHNFLITQYSTLKNFKLMICDASAQEGPGDNVASVSTFRIPKMDAIQSFYLRMFGFQQARVQFWGEAMPACFPALKRFTFIDEWNGRKPGQEWLDEMNLMTHHGVTELSLGTDLEALKAVECVLFNSIGFPSLTTLNIVVNECTAEELGRLWAVWPNLQNLRMAIHEPWLNFDEFLSGVPASRFSELNMVLVNLKRKPMNLDALLMTLNKFKIQPGISDLKYLRNFRVTICDGCLLHMTDIGGCFGLAMASSNLQHIEINQTADQMDPISAECRELIRKTKGPFAVISL